MKHRHAKLTCRRALQGCDGRFRSVPHTLRLGPRDSPVNNCPWDPRGRCPRERTGSPWEEAAHCSSQLFSGKLLPTSTRGLCCTRKRKKRSSIYNLLPVRSCLFPTSSHRGFSRQQRDTVTNDCTQRQYLYVSDSTGISGLFLFLKPLLPG